jgi:predicted small metal-binding protein
MAKLLRCRDLGLDCPFEAKGETVDEVLQTAYAHALVQHQEVKLTPELIEQAQAAIKDE